MDDARMQATVLEDAPSHMLEHSADHDPTLVEADEVARLAADLEREELTRPTPVARKRPRRGGAAKNGEVAPLASDPPEASAPTDSARADETPESEATMPETDGAAATPDANEPTADSEARDIDSDDAEQTGARPRVAPDEVIDAANGLTFARVVEAMLFGSDSSLAPARLADLIGVGTSADVKAAVAYLNEQYEAAGLSFRVAQIARGYQLHTEPAYGDFLMRLHSHRGESRLTEAAMETLSIIAYRQPITRAEIESIRGVAVGDGINRLRDAGVVKVVGRAEVVGRPQLFGTTRKFLQLFGLSDLKDLPPMENPPTKSAPKSE